MCGHTCRWSYLQLPGPMFFLHFTHKLIVHGSLPTLVKKITHTNIHTYMLFLYGKKWGK